PLSRERTKMANSAVSSSSSSFRRTSPSMRPVSSSRAMNAAPIQQSRRSSAFVAPDIAVLRALRSAQRLHPIGYGLSDLVRRIFLDEVNPLDRQLGQVWHALRLPALRWSESRQARP